MGYPKITTRGNQVYIKFDERRDMRITVGENGIEAMAARIGTSVSVPYQSPTAAAIRIWDGDPLDTSDEVGVE